jgi:hypothetical protein
LWWLVVVVVRVMILEVKPRAVAGLVELYITLHIHL